MVGIPHLVALENAADGSVLVVWMLFEPEVGGVFTVTPSYHSLTSRDALRLVGWEVRVLRRTEDQPVEAPGGRAPWSEPSAVPKFVVEIVTGISAASSEPEAVPEEEDDDGDDE